MRRSTSAILIDASRRCAALLAFALFCAPAPAAAQTINFFMTEIPGQTMIDEAEPGIAIVLVRAAAKRIGVTLDERFLPWARAVKLAESSANAVIAPFSRTPSRERRFRWIAELYQLQFGFVSLDKPIDSFDAARELRRVGVWRATSMEEALRNRQFTNLQPVGSDEALARMLSSGRIDAWYGSLGEATFKFRGIEQVNRRTLQFGAALERTPVWLAAGGGMDLDLAGRLRDAIIAERISAEFKALVRQYGFDPLP